MLENCPTLTIMISSCEWIDYIPNVPSSIIQISELDRQSSVEFFLQIARTCEISAQEVYQLVEKYPCFDFKNVLPGITDEKERQLTSLDSLKKNPNLRKQVLSAHDLFTQFDGNPYSIKTIASFYKNPNIARNDLLGIYERLLEPNEDSDNLSLTKRTDNNALIKSRTKTVIQDALTRRNEVHRKCI